MTSASSGEVSTSSSAAREPHSVSADGQGTDGSTLVSTVRSWSRGTVAAPNSVSSNYPGSHSHLVKLLIQLVVSSARQHFLVWSLWSVAFISACEGHVFGRGVACFTPSFHLKFISKHFSLFYRNDSHGDEITVLAASHHSAVGTGSCSTGGTRSAESTQLFALVSG